jgi:hypothetical protein
MAAADQDNAPTRQYHAAAGRAGRRRRTMASSRCSRIGQTPLCTPVRECARRRRLESPASNQWHSLSKTAPVGPTRRHTRRSPTCAHTRNCVAFRCPTDDVDCEKLLVKAIDRMEAERDNYQGDRVKADAGPVACRGSACAWTDGKCPSNEIPRNADIRAVRVRLRGAEPRPAADDRGQRARPNHAGNRGTHHHGIREPIKCAAYAGGREGRDIAAHLAQT